MLGCFFLGYCSRVLSPTTLTTATLVAPSHWHPQIALRWGVQRGYNMVPKSTQLERLKENLSVFDFELPAEDMAAISALDRHRRFNDPGVYTKFMGEYYPIFG